MELHASAGAARAAGPSDPPGPGGDDHIRRSRVLLDDQGVVTGGLEAPRQAR